MREHLGLKDVEVEFSTTKVQEDISITVEDIRTRVSKMANWKAASPDLVQGFWFKKLTGLYSRLQECLQDCICQANVTIVDFQGKNSFDTKGPSEGRPGQQLLPYCLPTNDVETLDRNHGRKVIPPLGKEWTANE